ncbi:MAG: hypothetical protein ACI9MR_004638 [Myxococcota bacterium]|jgi:hypothetical protein
MKTMTIIKRAAGFALLALVSLSVAAPVAAEPLTNAEMVSMLEEVDTRQSNVGDYKAHVFIQQKEKGKEDIVFEAVIYRRDADDKFMLLFLGPKNEAGKGYLRIDQNLWLYAPSTGKWERVTERERIAGTDSRRRDFDESRLSAEYTPTYLGEGKLGKFATHKLKLAAKRGIDVAYPVMEIEIDQQSGNVLKSQEFALSGRTMRTSYYPKWHKVMSETKGAEVWFPKDMRFYDEVEKGNSSVVKIDKIDLSPLDKNIFTKAWLESKSR